MVPRHAWVLYHDVVHAIAADRSNVSIIEAILSYHQILALQLELDHGQPPARLGRIMVTVKSSRLEA
jgi:hypothetical protein